MPKKSKLVPYSLKLDEELWNQINKNRMSLVGVLVVPPKNNSPQK
jgi:hypothetical protein